MHDMEEVALARIAMRILSQLGDDVRAIFRQECTFIGAISGLPRSGPSELRLGAPSRPYRDRRHVRQIWIVRNGNQQLLDASAPLFRTPHRLPRSHATVASEASSLDG